MNKKSTHNHLSEDALMLNAIIETATDGIITIGENGVIEMANSAAAHLFGYEIDELLGNSVNMLMPSPHQENHDGYIKNYLQSGVAKIIGIGREVTGRKKDGATFPIRLSISEVKLNERRIFTGIVHDLSRQKKIEKDLRAEKERAQRYLDIANTIIVVIGRDGQVQLLNDKGCRVLDLKEEEAVGRNWFGLAIPEESRQEIKSVFQTLMEGRQIDYYENNIINHRGERRLIAWHNAVLYDEQGNISGTISSGIDITAQRKAEDRIIRLNAELEKRVDERTDELAEAVNQLLDINKKLQYEVKERKAAEEEVRRNESRLRRALEKEKELSNLKSRFVSMASHEFRTPLSTILSSADLIEAYTAEEHQKKRIRHTTRIKSSVANLTGILNDFLSLSRLEEGHFEAEPAWMELNQFCDEAIGEIQGLLRPGQHIEKEGRMKGVKLFLDKKMLKNILFNLFSNAIKYSEDNKPVVCRMEVIGNNLHIAIIDQGIGIPEEEQQHLFTRFFRAHNVENIQGTGLGLNIVKRYVDLMNGTIRFESRLGEGSAFYVTLPLQQQAAPVEDEHQTKQ
ncbi:MAG: PAS domain S-box protein [Lewinellaceae bacterium]|nr:PAS domain S-box protein [Phaeodactylibacter sp.]MCB0614636.1 PAS domain S-box protein [Phaeodactylibacter sp.]MCB9348569.1 PAS domain S-box protein [Lewinellaceae bacterium]